MREIASDENERLDLEDRFVFGIGGVKVRRVVLPPEHLDRDPEKAADGRLGMDIQKYTMSGNALFEAFPESQPSRAE